MPIIDEEKYSSYRNRFSQNYKPIEYQVLASGCWECISHRCLQKGYIKIGRHGKAMRLTRYIYWLYHDTFLPSHIVVRHACDNPWCINPEHLIEGTQRDNALDREMRGRGNKRVGVRHPKATVTREQYHSIMTLYNNGVARAEISRRTRLGWMTINRIVSDQNYWVHREYS